MSIITRFVKLTCKCAAILGVLATFATGNGLQASSLGYADGFNVFVFTSLQTSSDIGGRVAAGTSMTGTFGIGNHLTSNTYSWDAIAGSGVASGSQIHVNSTGNAYVPNGVSGANVLINGQGRLVTDGLSPIDFAAAQAFYSQLSSSWAQLTPTGTLSSQGQVTANSSGLNVFDLTAAEFLNLSSIDTHGGTVLINVAGAPGLNNNNMLVDGQQNTPGSTTASKVIFNFYEDRSTLTLGNAFGGSVLAPYATVMGTSQYNGTLIANALNFQGEIHSEGEFTGTAPIPVPEPSMVYLVGIGVGGWLWRQTRKRKVVAETGLQEPGKESGS
jgi:choice-of-anchor A domain-containing protein